jgi:uncharacterized protein YaaR (DUF327 family)
MKKKFALIFLALAVLSSCTTLQSWTKAVTKYDQKSYENFTSLKAELNAFIEMVKPETPQDKIDIFYLIYNKIYEYEKGKGLANHETIAQLELLKGRIDDFVGQAQASDLSQFYKDAKVETLDRILDVIISTEYARPRA